MPVNWAVVELWKIGCPFFWGMHSFTKLGRQHASGSPILLSGQRTWPHRKETSRMGLVAPCPPKMQRYPTPMSPSVVGVLERRSWRSSPLVPQCRLVASTKQRKKRCRDGRLRQCRLAESGLH
ncbi:hypothetical protein VTK26DRAFT_5002 [Humicola hyalothermophila]